jgi:prophage antirepressor-like protein
MSLINDKSVTSTTTSTNMKSINFFEYEMGSIRVYGTVDEPWFMAKDVATCLEYSDTAQAIRKNVDIEDRCHLEQTVESGRQSPNNQPHTVLINESGVYSLILRSKKPQAKKFKRWVTSELLPSIRKTGSYTMPVPDTNHKENKTRLFLENVSMAKNLLIEFGTFDKRVELLFSDLVQNSVIGVTTSIECQENNENWPLSRRLSETFNITSTLAHKKLFSFGKIVSSEYKNLYGVYPEKHNQFVNGAVRKVNSYFTNHYIELIDDLIKDHFSKFITPTTNEEEKE